ncbi:type III secretion system protein SctP [Trinickia acidisoli]|uniref:type III secretion system protein SctP n=1 Tax=Trinickia acidisoli TaxID=2767482 RepID=UPI001A8D695F|nr:type III secretion system protein SctP [Trinickia acidisoli]
MMGIIRTYAVHAIDDDDLGVAPAARAEARKGFDYAALVRRARVGARAPQRRQYEGNERHPDPNEREHVSEHEGSQAHRAPNESQADSGTADERSPHAPQEDACRSSIHQDSSSSSAGGASLAQARGASAESLTQQLQRLDTPYLEALAREQHAVFVLIDYLAARVADFCSDPAVLAQGHWSIDLTLDPAILPDCRLALTLSQFDLALRFDTQHASSKQLVLHHGDVLKRRLEALLTQHATQHDMQRTVEIVVE